MGGEEHRLGVGWGVIHSEGRNEGAKQGTMNPRVGAGQARFEEISET